MADPLTDLLILLHEHDCKPRRSGTGWEARCPAHEDREPSLSIGVVKNGQILVNCFANCSVEQIVQSLGLRMSDLFNDNQPTNGTATKPVDNPVSTPDKPRRTFERLEDLIVAISRQIGHKLSGDWGYFDASGKLIGGVLRFDVLGGKEIRPVRRTSDGRWELAHLPSPRVLYNLHLVHKAEASVPIIVAEGEKAADAVGRMLRAAGLPGVGTTSSGGASAPNKTNWQPLAKRTVIVWPDNDAAGRKYAEAVGSILTGLGCTVKLFDPARRFQLPDGFDAADAEADPSTLGCEDPADVARLMLDAAEPWTPDEPTPEPSTATPTLTSDKVVSLATPTKDGAALLDEVRAFLKRFIAYPSEAAAIAHTVWSAHCHVVEAFEMSPRLAFLSPEPGSGKSQCLELTAVLVPNPVHAVNVTPAYMFRRVGQGSCTVLLDEADTIFGNKPTERSEKIRALVNAGHRRGATVGRCIVKGKEVIPVECPAFAAVALAGLHELPPTIMSRAVVVRMRRRRPGESITPYRIREHEPQGHRLRDELSAWLVPNLDRLRDARPEMPDGLTDRPADCWEPLLAIADLAGGHWPGTARRAAMSFVREAAASAPQSLGVQLLADLKAVFADRTAMSTDEILIALNTLEESPWAEYCRGQPLNARALARLLGQYCIKPRKMHRGAGTTRGYHRSDLEEAWLRYVPSSLPEAEQVEQAEQA